MQKGLRFVLLWLLDLRSQTLMHLTSRRRCKPTSTPNIAHRQHGNVIFSYISLQVDDVPCEINIAIFDGYRPKPKFMVDSETFLA
jgi:hypothetical protein